MTSITHVLQRETMDEADPVKEIEIVVDGQFYNGDLEDFTTTPDVELTDNEHENIVRKLYEEYDND